VFLEIYSNMLLTIRTYRPYFVRSEQLTKGKFYMRRKGVATYDKCFEG